MHDPSYQALKVQFPEYQWRAAGKPDAEKILAMLLVRDEHDDIDGAGTVEGLLREFDDPWLQYPETNFILALTEKEDVAAFGAVFVNPEPENKRTAGLWLEVHPHHRGAGIRRGLLSWAENRAGSILKTLNQDLEAVIRISCEEKLEELTKFYGINGFQSERFFFQMNRDLSQPIPPLNSLDPFTLVPYDAALDEALFRAFNEAFLDHWSFEAITPEEWKLWFTSDVDFRPDLSFLVMADDQIAGFSINGVNLEINERKGVKEGWIHQLGTRSEWRRRGIATDLIIASMQAFKEEGLQFAKLGVDTQNPTGALKIYERLGFKSIKRIIIFSKNFID